MERHAIIPVTVAPTSRLNFEVDCRRTFYDFGYLFGSFRIRYRGGYNWDVEIIRLGVFEVEEEFIGEGNEMTLSIHSV